MSEVISHSSLDERRAGVLLHLTSLPGEAETGDLGPEAYHFVDFLNSAGMSVWQMLPIGPTQADGSPYQSCSVHAGNAQLISLQKMVERGYLEPSFLNKPHLYKQCKDYGLLEAWRNFHQHPERFDRKGFETFLTENRYWLDDYALYQSLHKEFNDQPWWEWPAAIRDREPQALAEARARLSRAVEYVCFEQYLFFQQWFEFKTYANRKGIKLFGDMPIFVAHDSAEVWAKRQFFYLDELGQTEVVAGVPPDYFSETGQRWGNPLYRWNRMVEDGFSFWIDRLKTQLKLFDIIRIDHFRGFEAYWEIPASEEYAVNGKWVKAPGDMLFDRLHELYDPLPLVAEDLGIITPEVDALRTKYALPGMKILQFAFSGEPDNPYLSYNHPENSVVYTGTHDNDTTLGWYRTLNDGTRHNVDEYLGYSKEPMPWPLIRHALASRARLAVIPMQDLLALDGEHRMNLPGTTEGNWQWRFEWSQVEADLAERIRHRVRLYNRLVTH
ncbi:MAG: 4-alpha-glucanotransferase [Chromatiales bacterium]|nr:4-alpha-glucanotransferase [Chromatiales bacterium]